MKASSLHGKTVRPGSLNGYSYYYSNRQPQHSQSPSTPKSSHSHRKLFLLVAVMVFSLPLVVHAMQAPKQPVSNVAGISSGSENEKQSPKTSKAPVAAPAKAVNHCEGNTEAKMAKIDISEHKLWACEGSQPVYDSVVITGMASHASTITPPGTYTIYGKQTDTKLTGADEAGSWDRDVSYWMPFLSNQYGIYGFHDATWRPNSDFGRVDPSSDEGSHGCVELPLAASAWLYNWAEVGTTVIIQD